MRYSKCIILLFDGARYDVFSDLLKANKLPNIKRYILSEGTFLKGYSTLISTTGPAHIPFLYGIFPGRANVPGIRWFDKNTANRKNRIISGMRSYVGAGCFAMGNDIANEYVPVYNYFSKPGNIFSSLNKQFTTKVMSNPFQKVVNYLFAHYTNKWGWVDQSASNAICKLVKQKYDFMFSVFPGIDELSHLHHPGHDLVLRQYCKLDTFVNKLFRIMPEEESRKTLIFIVSDHGLSGTHTHIPLVKLCEDEGLIPIFFPKIFKEHFDVAILESGNAGAFVYFMESVKNRPSFYEEIVSIKKNRRFINRLLSHEGIDFIAYRINNCSIGARNRYGEIIIDQKDNSQIKLECKGTNPLEFGVDDDRILLKESLHLTINTQYPDSIVQLVQMFRSRRTGDIVVFAKDGFDLREKYEWPEHKSSHGTLGKSHMEVPICTNIKLKSSFCRTVDIFPTILHKMKYPIPENIDGRVIS